MSAWWNDVETYHGAKGATRSGMFAALGFVVTLGITAAYLGATGSLPQQKSRHRRPHRDDHRPRN
jgi:hypothetical protein